jgi:hypothetical protein
MTVADSKSHEEQYRLLMDALAESVLGMSDQDVEAEFDAEPAPQTKRIFQAAAKRHAQAKLHAAQAQFEEASKSIRARKFEMPRTAAERRTLLDAVLASQQSFGQGALTAQFRELKSVSDSDVESTLQQLEALGVLSEFRKQKGL